jgi:hypothetical protein
VPKIKTDTPLKLLDGQPLNGEDGRAMTLKAVCVNALLASFDEDRNMLPEKALARWKLAVRLHAGGDVEVTPEELTEIRARVPKQYTVLVSGQALEMLV